MLNPNINYYIVYKLFIHLLLIGIFIYKLIKIIYYNKFIKIVMKSSETNGT
jgi:hypothetical protein